MLNKAERAFASGQRYAQKRDFESAERRYRKALELRPEYSGVYLHYALALSEMERYDEAEEKINRAIELRPNNSVYYMFLGCILFDRGNFEAAAEAFNKSLEIHPANQLVKNYLSLAFMAQGRMEEAILNLKTDGVFSNLEMQLRMLPYLEDYLLENEDVLREIESEDTGPSLPDKQSSDQVDVRNQRLLPIVGRILIALKMWMKKRKARRYLSRGGEFLEENKPYVALPLLKRALELNPDIRDGHFLLGLAYLGVGKYKLAKSELNAVDQNGGYYQQVALALGVVHYKMGELEKALEYMGKTDDDDASTHYYRGLVYLAGKEHKKSQEELRMALTHRTATHAGMHRIVEEQLDKTIKVYAKKGESGKSGQPPAR